MQSDLDLVEAVAATVQTATAGSSEQKQETIANSVAATLLPNEGPEGTLPKADTAIAVACAALIAFRPGKAFRHSQ